jgi:predicted tellurium resistance membrane protein TerC
MFCSGVIANLMDRYPVLADIGAGILGWTGGEMIVDDAWIKPWLGAHVAWVKWVLPAFCAVGVIAAGRLLSRLQAKPVPEAEPAQTTTEPAPHP